MWDNGVKILFVRVCYRTFWATFALHLTNVQVVKKSHIIVLILIAVCIGVFASKLGNVSSYSSYKDAKTKPGESVQLIGTLAKGKAVNFDPIKDPNSFSFTLLDRNGDEVQVICFDDMPTDFEKSEEIVLTGTMKDDTFYANEMLVKCPSKYQENEIKK